MSRLETRSVKGMINFEINKKLNNKIALIRPKINRWRLYSYYFPFGSKETSLGLLYIASHLIDNGFNVIILDGENLCQKSLLDRLSSFNPAVIGITCTTFSFHDAITTLTKIRILLPDSLNIIGGPHVTALPQKTLLENPVVDICVIGEGEESMLEIVSGRPLNDIKGIAWRNSKSEIYTNSNRPYTENIDKYNIYFHLLEGFPSKYKPPWQSRRFGKKSISLMASRGCPYNCSFCAGPIVLGKKRRPHSPQYTVNLMIKLSDEYGINDFYFHDDYFTEDISWLNEFCEILIFTNKTFSWACASRLEKFNKTILSKMKQAGCYQIGIGIESGSNEVLRTLKKNSTVKKIENGINQLQEIEIQQKIYLIIGTPKEELRDIFRTVKFINKLKVKHVQVLYFTPLPGTYSYKKKPVHSSKWSKMNLLQPLQNNEQSAFVLKVVEFGIYLIVFSRYLISGINILLNRKR